MDHLKGREPSQPLIWLTLFFMVFIWFSVLETPDMRSWPVAIPFSLLIIAGGALHGSIKRIRSEREGAYYIAAQLAVGGAAMLVTRGQLIALTLYAPLIGEVFGIMTGMWARLLSLLALVAAWFGVLLATGQIAMARTIGPGALVGTVFLGIFVTLFSQQIRERERAEGLLAELEQAHSRLREYALQVEELTVAEERQRMARELHDTLAQGLAGLIMQLEAIDDLLARGESERARAITGRALQRARGSLSEARVAIQALRTPLERGSILQIIAELADEFRADSGIDCTVDVSSDAAAVSGAAAGQVQRIVREALANAARHSEARHVTIRLSSGNGEVEVEIIDDGRGFDLDAVPSGHFGLIGLRERVRLGGGSLEIDSHPGAGTRLRAKLPLVPGGVESHE